MKVNHPCGCVTSYLIKPLCPAHIHAQPHDLTVSPRSQIHRTRRAYTIQTYVCEPQDLQLPCQHHFGTLRECCRRFRHLRPEGARSFLQISRTSQDRLDNSDVLRGFSQLFAPKISTHQNDRPACVTGGGVDRQRGGPLSSLVSLSSSLPAGWPFSRATSRASSSRLFDADTFFRQDTSFRVGHRSTDLWQGLTCKGRLESGGGARN